MDDTTDNEDKKKGSNGDSESGSASTTSGFVRPATDTVARVVNQSDETEETKRKKRGEGEGEAGGAAGTAYVRPSGEGIVRLSVDQTKKVWADFRHLDLNEVVAAVAEFFSEFPARASANLSVAWGNAKGGYAIINMAIKFGQDVAMAVKERTRESAVQIRRRYGINLKFKQRGGVGVTIPNPQAGLN